MTVDAELLSLAARCEVGTSEPDKHAMATLTRMAARKTQCQAHLTRRRFNASSIYAVPAHRADTSNPTGAFAYVYG